ncbi:hypothetical protein [Paenibacillus tuaregi]|uniref:hypothetical protein n=1 Tax=Paenibacillus tuaregi TaxID=1816681 RepID=UPI000839899E|nr:hypothetical protein [Paenibacillus tuaregi]
MSTKADKFKNLMRSPAGAQESKAEIIKDAELANSPANELVQISGKKKATFELDAELHRWLKVHALTINKDMVQIIEELLRRYRSETERR